MSSIFEQNLARLVELHQRERAARHHIGKRYNAHSVAQAEFFENYDKLAFPGGLESGLVRLSAGEAGAIEDAIRFLEADPIFFRSGYIKQRMLQRLKHVPLTDEQQSRLARLIVRSVDGGGRREFRGYARLAGTLLHAEVEAATRQRLASGDAEVRRRAEKTLEIIVQRKNERPN